MREDGERERDTSVFRCRVCSKGACESIEIELELERGRAKKKDGGDCGIRHLALEYLADGVRRLPTLYDLILGMLHH